MDENPLLSVNDTYEWLEVQNLEILEGLQKNDRIMIEGPPGSGKNPRQRCSGRSLFT